MGKPLRKRLKARFYLYYRFLQDAETGQRGYILTSNLSYLEPYELAVGEAMKRIDDLASTIADNPKQVEQVKIIRKLAIGKLEGAQGYG